MSEKEIKIHINKKITPLALVADKYEKYKIQDLIIEIDHKTIVVMNEVKEKYDLSEKESHEIEKELSYILANFLIYQVEMHDNIVLDDFVSFLIEIISFDIQHFIEVKKESYISEKPTLYRSIQKSFLEICKFHDTLFFSEIITLDELQELNHIHLQEMMAMHYEIFTYLKKNKNNDIDYIYNTTILIDDIYSTTLSNLFNYLTSNEKLLNNYKKNIKQYISKTKDLFLEKYSIIININKNYYKKITKT